MAHLEEYDGFIQRCCEDEKPSYFMLPRNLIETPLISPEVKGYFAMYKSECIDWLDIPEHLRTEINNFLSSYEGGVS